MLPATDTRTTSGHGQSTWAVHGELNDPENGAQEDRLNLKECWDVFRPHRQHLRRSAQQAPGLMGDGQRAGGGGVGRIRPAVQGLDRVVAGSHCHTGRLVPKAVDYLDKRKGRLADCGLWRIVDHAAMGAFSVLSVEGRPALLFGKSCKAVIIHGSSVKRILYIQFSPRHDVIKHRSRIAFGSVSGRLNRTVTPSATLMESRARADLGRRYLGRESPTASLSARSGRQKDNPSANQGSSQLVFWWHPFRW